MPLKHGKAAALRFAEQIKTIMAERSISRRELAHRLNMADSQLCNILNGKQNMTMLTMCQVAHALDYTIKVRIRPEESKQKITKGAWPVSKEMYTVMNTSEQTVQEWLNSGAAMREATEGLMQ